jgi:hypothetical protein
MEQVTQITQAIVQLKDNPVALVSLIALAALTVTAYAIRAVIVALSKREGGQ